MNKNLSSRGHHLPTDWYEDQLQTFSPETKEALNSMFKSAIPKLAEITGKIILTGIGGDSDNSNFKDIFYKS